MRAMSQADLDKAQGEFDASRAAVYSAQAKVKEMQLNLSYATIRSPVTASLYADTSDFMSPTFTASVFLHESSLPSSFKAPTATAKTSSR